MLELSHVTRHFGGLAAVNDVSFVVERGQILGLIGPNGAGKTTLLNLISGLVPLTSGEIRLAGRSLAGLPAHRIAQAGIARTYQNIRLFEEMTVLDNLLVGCHLRARTSWLAALLALPTQRREEAALRVHARALLERMGMQEVERDRAGALAYGNQRRVEILRAIAADPILLLLDEPGAGMNATETGQLGEFILSLREQGLTLIVIEHDMNLIAQVCDRVVVLNFGEVISQGTPNEIKADRRVIEAYLGTEE